MKRILSVAVVFFALVGSAPASTPETAQCLLTLGNKLYVLEKNLEAKGALAAIIADPALDVNPTELFGLSEGQIATYRPTAFGADADVAALGMDLTAPLYVILGQDAEAVWAMNVAVVKAAPELIHAVMKGQTAVVGATYDPKTGCVTILGGHPDLPVLAGQHILGIKDAQPAPETPAAANTAVKAVSAEQTPSSEAEKTETVDAEKPKAEPAEAEDIEAAHAKPADAHATPEAGHEATSESGGSGPVVIILFIIALIGTVIFMDKTVLKP